jgi:hypothetical protein
MKFTAIILIGLALLGGGCATSNPSAYNEPPWPPSPEHQPDTVQNVSADSGPVWSVIYWVAYFGGQVLASR